MVISKTSDKNWKQENRAVLFTCDEAAYRDILAYIQSVHGAHIYYTKSSRMRMVIEERGF